MKVSIETIEKKFNLDSFWDLIDGDACDVLLDDENRELSIAVETVGAFYNGGDDFDPGVTTLEVNYFKYWDKDFNEFDITNRIEIV